MLRFLTSKIKINVQPAYTIIELVIAASIIVLITSISLPKYQVFSDRQEFIKKANNLTDCIQKAQQLAVDEGNQGTAITLVEADLDYDLDSGVLFCEIRTHDNMLAVNGDTSNPKQYPRGSLYPYANLCDSNGVKCEISEMNIFSVSRSDTRYGINFKPNNLLTFGDLTNTAGHPLRIIFGTKQRGIPLAIYQSKNEPYNQLLDTDHATLHNRTTTTIDNVNEENQWGYDTGIDIKLDFIVVSDNYKASIRISPLGTPINLEIE